MVAAQCPANSGDVAAPKNLKFTLHSGPRWKVSLPLSLCLTVGTLSRKGPVRTYAGLTPLVAGIGWALTIHIIERMLVQTLRGAQTLLYLIFSLRWKLDWAIDCEHSYNTRLCNPFNDKNATHAEYHHYPDNFWPAQEFNRYLIRGNPIDNNNLSNVWEPNEWYFGRSYEKFFLTLPSLPLMLANGVIWVLIYALVVRFPQDLNKFLTRFCIVLPVILYFVVLSGTALGGISYQSTEEAVPREEVEKVPLDFWTDLKGFYRSTIAAVDYSTAFTGIGLLVVSRLDPGSPPVLAWILVPLMMIVPTMLSLLVAGCEGHISKLQPAYKTYGSIDETYSFDVIPVCLATSTFGSGLAVLFYLAHLFYASIGPLIIYTLFLHSAFSEQFVILESHLQSYYGLFMALTTGFAAILFMPLGTKIAAFFDYASQSSIVHLIIYATIFFVYGWQTLETDISLVAVETTSGSMWRYFLGPTSPIYTMLLFTVVPMFLCTKGVAVYDLLIGGNDVLKHIDAGTQFITAPLFIRRICGYGIMLAPLLVILAFAAHAMLSAKIRSLSLGQALKPSSDWLSHQVMQHRPKPYSLAYTIFNNIRGPTYRTYLLVILILELFFFLVLACLLFGQLYQVWTGTMLGSANYRTIVLLLLLSLHAIALIEMRAAYNFWDDPARLTVYIAVATLQMAFLNGYMWMLAFNHSWGGDLSSTGPIFLLVVNTAFRSACICAAIAVRAHIREAARPSRVRDATEIYASDGPPEVEMDAEDDLPIFTRAPSL
ncbi:unnamed protein product, partial [Mesorhabditis spiculigera]